jgi:membrane-associated protease RseP (regulator of RpoE activity)
MFPSTGTDPATPATSATESAKPGKRTLLLAIGGTAAAVALGAVAFVFLTSGGGEDPVAAPAKGTPAASASPAAKPSPAATKPSTTIKTVTVAARDPFAMLFPPTPTAAPTSNTTNTTTQNQTGTTPVTPVSAKLTLAVSGINLAKQTATITVDGVKYATSVGKVFDKTFVMYSVFNSSCVGLLYGDQNVAVCTANPVAVST